MNTDVALVEKAIADFDRVGAGIAALKERFTGLVFPVESAKGLDDAKKARAEIREPRYEVEKIRKAAKAPILALGKKLDGDAARITSELLAIEEPIDQQIKLREEQVEAARQEKIAAEIKRTEDIRARVEVIRQLPLKASRATASEAQVMLDNAKLLPIDASYAEFQGIASDALAGTIAALTGIVAERTAHEAEQSKIAAEREELAARRRADDERAAAERATAAKEQAAAKARQDAADAAAREHGRQEDEKRAAEQRKLDEQAAELRRQQETLAAATRASDEAARKAKRRRPSQDEIVAVLANHFKAEPAKVREWLKDMFVSEQA